MTSPQGPHATHSHEASTGRLWVALGLIAAFMAGEVVAGVVAHSLALLSDAGHMLTDAGALALALGAARLADRPPKGGLTFGLRRVEILSALFNAATLFVLAALIVVEGIRRLAHPPSSVQATTMLVVALVGIGVNLLATGQLESAARGSLNIRASYRHILTDLYAFIGTALAAVVIMLTGFQRADAIASLGVAVLMLRASIGLLGEAGRVLLEAAPEGVEPRDIGMSIEEHPCVTNVHDLHVWEITSGFPALSAHVLVRPNDDCHAVREDLETMLQERFNIDHTTLQVDHDQSHQLLQIERAPAEGTRAEQGSETGDG